MIYATCGNCGFIIDIFGKEDEASPVRGKRLKYLLTRDQICPNCLVAIYHCQKLELDESDVPVLKVEATGDERESLRAFAKEKGYAEVTEFTLNQFKHPEAAAAQS